MRPVSMGPATAREGLEELGILDMDRLPLEGNPGIVAGPPADLVAVTRDPGAHRMVRAEDTRGQEVATGATLRVFQEGAVVDPQGVVSPVGVAVEDRLLLPRLVAMAEAWVAAAADRLPRRPTTT